MLCIHHNDLDGQCAAAIVRRKFRDQSITFYETTYDQPLPPVGMLKGAEIVIVDFSYKPDDMQRILELAKGVTWIDHHKTAERYPYQYLAGLRDFKDKAYAGCELTWIYYNQWSRIPAAVRLIGDYDKWALQLEPSKAFYEGMKLLPTNPESTTWDDVIEKEDILQAVIDAGRTAMRYRDNYCDKLCDEFGYQARFGEHIIFACNQCMFGSGGFVLRFYQYPFVAAYIHDGNRYTVSLYSETVDVGEIARANGGGGHKGAAGFTCQTLPFTRIA